MWRGERREQTVLRTVDGGRTWQLLPVPGAEKLDFRDVDAMSDRVAHVLSIGAGAASRIYTTTDGGAHGICGARTPIPKSSSTRWRFGTRPAGLPSATRSTVASSS